MAENITVDELAIKLSANADAASTSLTRLGSTVERVAAQLAPLEKTLQTVTNMLRASKGSERALTQALKSTGTSATAAANDTEKAANRIARAYTKVASMQGKFAAVPFVAPTLSAPTTAATATATAIPTASTATTKRVGLVGGAVDKLKAKFAGMETTGTKAVKNVGMSFVQLRSWVFFAMFAIAGITATLGVFVKGAMDYFEQMHLFGTVFGDIAGDVNAYADALTGALGIDPVAFKRTAATFYEMARAMNISTEAAKTMSQNFTQLTYDYASLFDMDFDTVFEKFRSAMAGQTRSIHQFGLDVTIAALQEEAWKEGITQSVSEMSKANKAILMHNAILRNSTRAQGDLARTITQPANMLRIMKDQFTVLARTIGFLFMPALQAILPWLITLAQVLNKVAQQFLALFGIKMPDWKSFTAGAAAAGQGTDDLFSDAVDGANAAKEALKDYTMGFDELHIINPATASGGSGSGASAGGGGATIAPFDVYDMIGGIDALAKIVDPVIEKFRVLGDVFAPFIGALKKLWAAFVPFAKNVWDGFKSFYRDVLLPLGVWTINEVGVWLIERLTAALEWFNEHPEAAKLIGKVIAAFTAAKGLELTVTGIGKIAGFLTTIMGLKSVGAIFAGIGDLFTIFLGAGDIVTPFGTFIASLMSFTMPEWMIAVGTFFSVTLPNAIGACIGFVSGLVAVMVGAGAPIGVAIGVIVAAVGLIVLAVASVVTFVKNNWEDIKNFTKEAFTAIWNIIKGIWDVIYTTVMIVVAMIGTVIINMWNSLSPETRAALIALWETVKEWFNKIKDFIEGIWDGIQEIMGRVWDTVEDNFKSTINTIIGYLNTLIRAVNGILRAAKTVDMTGILKNVSEIHLIPKMAQGGMPTLGSMFVAGEAGPELIGSYGGNPNTVMPLAESGFVEAMAAATFSAVSQAMKNAGGAGGSGDVYLDGVKVGEITQRSMMRAGKTGSLVSVRS